MRGLSVNCIRSVNIVRSLLIIFISSRYEIEIILGCYQTSQNNMDLEDIFYDFMDEDSIVFLLNIIVLSLGGILVNWKFLRNIKDDDKNRGPNSNGILIRDVMETHAKVQMVILPTLMAIYWMIKNSIVFSAWFYPFCRYMPFIMRTFRTYFAFNSLVVAAMRYTFIVHQDSVSSFGIEKAKRVYYYASIIIPVIIGLLFECTIDPTNPTALSLCINWDQNTHNITGYKTNISQHFSSPIYLFVHEYVSTETTYYIRIFVRACIWIIFGNVMEGVLYWKTFSYIRR